MNNHTTARKPLRLSENSHLLMERILADQPTPMPPYGPVPEKAERVSLKTLKPAKVTKS